MQGVRREVGNHAKVLNEVVMKKKSNPIDCNCEGECVNMLSTESTTGRSCEESAPVLKESIGHTEVEVVAGAFLGFLVTLVVYFIL